MIFDFKHQHSGQQNMTTGLRVSTTKTNAAAGSKAHHGQAYIRECTLGIGGGGGVHF